MLTKNDMARVVVQALYGLANLPAADNIHVKRRERRLTAAQLQRPYEQALHILGAHHPQRATDTEIQDRLRDEIANSGEC